MLGVGYGVYLSTLRLVPLGTSESENSPARVLGQLRQSKSVPPGTGENSAPVLSRPSRDWPAQRGR
jgi:hypothetical protein